MILAILEPMSWSLEEGAIKTIEVGLEELAGYEVWFERYIGTSFVVWLSVKSLSYILDFLPRIMTP